MVAPAAGQDWGEETNINVLELDLKSICRNMTTAHFELQKSLHPIFPMPPIKKGMWHEIVYL